MFSVKNILLFLTVYFHLINRTNRHVYSSVYVSVKSWTILHSVERYIFLEICLNMGLYARCRTLESRTVADTGTRICRHYNRRRGVAYTTRANNGAFKNKRQKKPCQPPVIALPGITIVKMSMGQT